MSPAVARTPRGNEDTAFAVPKPKGRGRGRGRGKRPVLKIPAKIPGRSVGRPQKDTLEQVAITSKVVTDRKERLRWLYRFSQGVFISH